MFEYRVGQGKVKRTIRQWQGRPVRSEAFSMYAGLSREVDLRLVRVDADPFSISGKAQVDDFRQQAIAATQVQAQSLE